MFRNFYLTAFLLTIGISAVTGQKKIKTHYLSKSKTAAEIEALDTKLEKAYYMFIGHFSNKAQADTSKTDLFKEQELICVPMWQKRAGEYWMYMSWYPANNIESPLSQLVYKITKYSRDTFLLERYSLPEAMRGTIWAESKAMDKFKPADLKTATCINYLIAKDNDEFYSQPRDENEYCPETAGSPFAFSQMEELLTAENVLLYGTFYDAKKNMLFSQKPAGVHFERSDKNNPKYLEQLYGKKKK